MHGTKVEGRTFTPPPKALWSKYSDSRQATYRSKRRKLPEERQLFCTDIQIPSGAPEKAFVKAWKLIISHRLRYAASFKRIAKESNDVVLKYRARDMLRLVSEGKKLDAFDYKLFLKVLDHIEVTPDKKLRIAFLSGTSVSVDNIY